MARPTSLTWADPNRVKRLIELRHESRLTIKAIAGVLTVEFGEPVTHGMVLGKLRRLSARDKPSSKPTGQRNRGAVPVPPWAWELREDYRDHAAMFGKFSAARHCRRLLAEARRGL